MTTITPRLHTVSIAGLTVTLLFLILLAPATSTAEGMKPIFGSWLAILKKEALDSGIPPMTVDRALGNCKPASRVIELAGNQPETKLSFNDYLSRVLSENRVTNGRRNLRNNRKLLGQIAARYGVQPKFLVALWGIETDFGQVTGSHPVIDSLVSLIYNGRRGPFFRKELMHALRILDEGHIPPARMKGSWAGAMGQLQFMPSTFRDFAVDFDGDGRIDIWDSQEDVFASAANYLSRSGWRKGQTWGQEVSLSNGARLKSADFKLQRRLSKWRVLGIRPLEGSRFPSVNLPASIVQPDGPRGPTFLVYNNYHVMRRWNNSHYFALSVGILADLINSP
jgi:membrane-bound lytic murein transglycosylase B